MSQLACLQNYKLSELDAETSSEIPLRVVYMGIGVGQQELGKQVAGQAGSH